MSYSVSGGSDSCYEGTRVLINKLGIRDEDELMEVETVITAAKITMLLETPYTGPFTAEHYRGLHRAIMGDLYDWAGEIRRVPLSKKGTAFHSPANLAKSIVIEAAELLECFQWSDEEYDLQHIKEELADVMVYSQNLLDKLGLDADEIINMKMAQNEAKYPVDKAKGIAAKYNRL